MKTFLLLFLSVTITFQLNAQYSSGIQYYYPTQNDLPVNIRVLLSNGITMTIAMKNLSQLDSIGNIDSLLTKVWIDLLPVKDSLNKPFVNKRIDYISSPKNALFRILEYAPKGNTYLYKNQELLQTKTEPDTLKIRLQTFNRFIKDSVRIYDYCFITMTLDNIQDIATMRPGMLDSAFALVKVKVRAVKPTKEFKKFNAAYDVGNHKFTHFGYDWNNPNKVYFEPDVYVGFQYARGAWVPSAAAGFQLIKGDYQGERDVYKLMWEPHFFFTRDATNSLMSDRNDFITFRYYHYEKISKPTDYYPTSFSVGYLVWRKGNWFEKNTFKFSVPGFQYKYLSLEPEFFFNNFFKHFSPSLKLNFNID